MLSEIVLQELQHEVCVQQGLRATVVGTWSFGDEGASRREVETNRVVEGKRNLVLRRCACSQRNAPDDATHGVNFLARTEFEDQA